MPWVGTICGVQLGAICPVGMGVVRDLRAYMYMIVHNKVYWWYHYSTVVIMF